MTNINPITAVTIPSFVGSFLTVTDIGLSGLLFLKFKDILNLNKVQDSVVQFPKEIAQREVAERRGGHEVEFINYWRSSISPDWQRMRTPAARRGTWVPYDTGDTGDDPLAINVRAIPVSIDYDIWFWSKDKDKLNQIFDTYLFWTHTNPNLSMNYRDQFPLNMYLKIGALSDESIVSQRYEKGMYFIYRMPLNIEGWTFLSEEPISNVIMAIDLTCYDKNDLEVYTEVIPVSEDYDEQKAEALRLFTNRIE
jgi:hypothetical protein